jgi:hypothetical protein
VHLPHWTYGFGCGSTQAGGMFCANLQPSCSMVYPASYQDNSVHCMLPDSTCTMSMYSCVTVPIGTHGTKPGLLTNFKYLSLGTIVISISPYNYISPAIFSLGCECTDCDCLMQSSTASFGLSAHAMLSRQLPTPLLPPLLGRKSWNASGLHGQ